MEAPLLEAPLDHDEPMPPTSTKAPLLEAPLDRDEPMSPTSTMEAPLLEAPLDHDEPMSPTTRRLLERGASASQLRSLPGVTTCTKVGSMLTITLEGCECGVGLGLNPVHIVSI